MKARGLLLLPIVPAVLLFTALVVACESEKVTEPAPPIPVPVQVHWVGLGGSVASCQPIIKVSVAGPVGSGITWEGMGIHTVEGAFDTTFDRSYAQRFWAGEGLLAGESASGNGISFALGAGPYHIAYRFTYTATDPQSTATLTDTVAVVCQ